MKQNYALFVIAIIAMFVVIPGVARAASAGGNTVTCTSLNGATPIDGISAITAALIPTNGQIITSTVDASGCGVGIYIGPGVTGVTISATVSNGLYAGIYVDNGNANVIGSNVFNIGDSPFSGDQYGVGILYVNGATGAITNTQVSLYQKGGIAVKGISTLVNVSNVVISGLGPVPIIAQNGVEFADEASGSITNSTIQGNSYQGGPLSGNNYFTATQSCGIILYDSSDFVQIFNNNVLNNDIGACIIANTLSIPVMVSNNQFGSSTEQDYGIVFDTINGISSNNMVSNALVGIMATTSASVNTLVTSSGDQFPGVNENYQAVSQFAYSPYYATIGPIINVTMTVKNDEDTGLVGYWALDNYTKHVTVWQTDANTYAANVTYLGMWHTFNGALSPQNGIIEPDNGTGTLQGSYTATFNTPTFNSMANTIGNLGTFDFGGTVNDILLGTYSSNQIGNQNPFDWVGYYFPGYTNFVQPTWSWTYTNNTYHFYGNQWVNSYAGNSGDIITGPTIKVTYNVRNDSDSRYSGYWALDNYTQTLTVWHIGADQYAVNAIDVGVSCTFAGAPSPNAGIPQVANGCAVMTGGYDGNLTTSNTPVNTTQTTLGTGTLNSGGKISGILNNAPTDTNDAYDSWINYFFPGTAPSSGFPSSVFNFANSGNGWGWTYTYGGGTVAKQTWVDAGAGPAEHSEH